MNFSLPKINKVTTKTLYLKKITSNSSLPLKQHLTEKNWSWITATLATVCLLLVMSTGGKTPEQLISPILSPFQTIRSFIQGKPIYDRFAFAPGWAPNKFSRINWTGLKTLAFFDLPVNADGSIHQDNDGYLTLRSGDAQDLFLNARANGTKVVLTLSQVNNDDIRSLLERREAQETLISQAISEVGDADVDGVVVDFEFTGVAESKYRVAYTKFIQLFTQRMHESIPGSIVNVAVGTYEKNSLYELNALAANADKVFIMAHTFAVPETTDGVISAPVDGYNKDEYLKNMTAYLEKYHEALPQDKIVVETAWYGNGDNYPLYSSDKQPSRNTPSQNTLSTPLSSATINRLVRDVPLRARAAARANLPLIAKALEKEGILNSNVLAYALATIEHETAGTFQPIDEFKGVKSARRLGYEGGTAYFGRGFIQLTHLINYKKFGERIGMGDKLAKDPELASNPEVAAQVLAAFFKDNNVAHLATQGNFVLARRPINPDLQGYAIAYLAEKYLEELA